MLCLKYYGWLVRLQICRNFSFEANLGVSISSLPLLWSLLSRCADVSFESRTESLLQFFQKPSFLIQGINLNMIYNIAPSDSDSTIDAPVLLRSFSNLPANPGFTDHSNLFEASNEPKHASDHMMTSLGEDVVSIEQVSNISVPNSEKFRSNVSHTLPPQHILTSLAAAQITKTWYSRWFISFWGWIQSPMQCLRWKTIIRVANHWWVLSIWDSSVWTWKITTATSSRYLIFHWSMPKGLFLVEQKFFVQFQVVLNTTGHYETFCPGGHRGVVQRPSQMMGGYNYSQLEKIELASQLGHCSDQDCSSFHRTLCLNRPCYFDQQRRELLEATMAAGAVCSIAPNKYLDTPYETSATLEAQFFLLADTFFSENFCGKPTSNKYLKSETQPPMIL